MRYTMGSFIPFVRFFLLCSLLTFPDVQPDVTPVVRSVNHFGAEIHKKLSEEGGNIFFSPLSISSALGMLLYGARGNTFQQMKSVMGFQDSNLTETDLYLSYGNLTDMLTEESFNASDEYSLYLANAVLIQKDYPILSNYVTGIQNIYHARARLVDFVKENNEVVDEINEWVRNKTHNQIDQLINEDDLDATTVLVLLNAVFFKGTWKIQFNPDYTYDGVFYNRGLTTSVTLVPMMHLKEEVLYEEHEGVKILELLYKGDDISMVILLPKEIDGLTQLEEELTPDTFIELRRLTRKTEMFVAFPKFKLEFTKHLIEVLEDLGMDIFSAAADFSGISENESLIISEVIHKAVIEVNEKGSKASAVTFIAQSRSLARTSQFLINRPFLFAIVDRRNDLILFQGRVEEF